MTEPYREPPQEDPIYIAPPPREWAGIVWSSIAIVIMGGLFYAGYQDCAHPAPPMTCVDYANYPSKDLPAKCTKTYDPTK